MVRSFGSLGCNCCSCTDCCNGSAPDEFDVDITLTDAGDCPACATFLSGTYTLARVSDGYGGGPCLWTYREGMRSDESNYPYPVDDIAFCDEGCVDVYECWYISYREVNVTIHCISDTQYRVIVSIIVDGVYYPPEPTNTTCPEVWTSRRFANAWYWQKDVDRADFDCATVGSESIPFSSRRTDCIRDTGFGGGFQPTVIPHWFCEDNPVDAVLSAVVAP